jgi:hypothetical protein
MGLLQNGILGKMTGKVAGVVGSSWKGRNTVRAYAIPSNPNSVAQQAQRALVEMVGKFGKLILASIIQTYWNPFAGNLSGWNKFTKTNLDLVSLPTDFDKLVTGAGSLEGALITAAEYTSGTGNLDVTWPGTHLGNGLDTDEAAIVIYDSVNQVAFVSDGDATRVDASATIAVGTGRTSANLKAYLFFHRGTGSDLIVSPSDYAQVADA